MPFTIRPLFRNITIYMIVSSLLLTSFSVSLLRSSDADAASIACATSELNIVAHHDDDILFMNPDISDSIQQKRCVQTVFLTAGEWNGTSTMTREQYSASRMAGTRAAYATMANVANNWTRTSTVINGYNIEVATLVGAPYVMLMYINIHDSGNSSDPDNLMHLYKGSRTSITTLVPTGSPAGVVSATYTKASLTQTLLSIINTHNVTLTRIQDYLPDPRLKANHGDHIFGALFAYDALRNYQGINGNLRSTIVTYRDYNIVDSPANLNNQQANTKSKIIDAYKAHDSIFAIPGGQGILSSRMYYRWPVSPAWFGQNQDGRLQAFDIQSGRLVTWTQSASGAWSSMSSLGNDSLQPGIGIGRNTDGTLQVFVIKQIIDNQGNVSQDLQYIRQASANGGFSPTWYSLGNPGPTPSGKYDTSSPIIVPNADGRLEVFIKDSDGDLATKVQTSPSGNFGGWMGFTAGDLIETPTAILRADGRIEVFSATRTKVKHWIQSGPNGPISYDNQFTPTVYAVGAPSAGLNQDGRPEIFYRKAGDGVLWTTWQMSNGWWVNGEANLGSQSSQGAPAVVNTTPVGQTNSRIALFARTMQSSYEYTAQVADNSSFATSWKTIGTYSQHSPAAIRDSLNRVHFLTISHEGVLTDTVTTP
jgi:hypothetical protein